MVATRSFVQNQRPETTVVNTDEFDSFNFREKNQRSLGIVS